MPIWIRFERVLTAENHTLKTSPHRSAAAERHRQCLLGRDSACRATFARYADQQAQAGRMGAALCCDAADVFNFGSTALVAEAETAISGKSHCVPQRDGRPWPLRVALSALWR